MRTTRFRISVLSGCIVAVSACVALWPNAALAAESTPILSGGQLNPLALIRAGGVIGYLIIALSIAMVALIIEHLLSIRRKHLIPRELAEELHQYLLTNQVVAAEGRCREQPTFLSIVLAAGLQEATFGYSAVEKAMEDAAVEQSARLARKIEYLSLIGGLAPMLGLMGTVWGMIQAFAEFTEKANPMPADFAPAISEALVTTLFGLCVAVPSLAAYAWFRNRIDELVAEAVMTAEYVATPLRRSLRLRRRQTAEPRPSKPPLASPPG